jgi:hypothetical protein
MLHPTLRFFLAPSAMLLLAACGDDDGMRPIDSGMMMVDGAAADTGPRRDAGTDAGETVELASCDMPRTLEGTIGTVSVSGDTTLGAEGERDLGPACGNADAPRWAPQEVIAYEVPGTGPTAVTATLVTDGTPESFDTVIQLRTDCTMIPAAALLPTCFDDTAEGVRSEAMATVEGGTTLFIIVTGYAETPVTDATDRGPYQLDVTARANELPAVTGGEVLVIGSRARVVVDGMDADMDPFGFVAAFQDAAGMPVDLNADGAADDGDRVAGAFDNLDELAGMAAYTGVATIDDLGTLLTDASATQAEVQLIDDGFGVGAAMTLMVRAVNEVGFGEACDMDNICAETLTCTAATCQATAEVTAACAAATPIVVTPPTTTTTTATASGMFAAGAGALAGSCGPTGSESIHTVTVPAGSYDLLARTDLAGTADTDTILYVRSTCQDPSTELACNDDIDFAAGTISSAVEVMDAAAGTYSIVVEPFGELDAAAPYELEVALRPVLATGAACDPMGVMNRCAGGACPAGMVCP